MKVFGIDFHMDLIVKKPSFQITKSYVPSPQLNIVFSVTYYLELLNVMTIFLFLIKWLFGYYITLTYFLSRVLH